ncbi:hypothetical protein Hanom_Chr13g01194721 [Helianthus anomalus]
MPPLFHPVNRIWLSHRLGLQALFPHFCSWPFFKSEEPFFSFFLDVGEEEEEGWV